MRKLVIPVIIVFTVILSVISVIGQSSTADAHNIIISYQAGRMDMVVYFSGGTPARNAHITIYKPDGTIYLEGETNEKGEFSFEPTVMQGEWKIVAEHSGHRAEIIIGEEIQGGTNEMPLYITVTAGLGYLIGLGGAAAAYMGWKSQRKKESETPS
jgi:predicted dehydrogenase